MPSQLGSYPDVSFVGGADASLDVDALRSLGLLRRNGAHQGGAVFAGHMADEGANCERSPDEVRAACAPRGRRASALTFAGVALPHEAHHEGRAVAALRGTGEGLDAQLVGFGLQRRTRMPSVTRLPESLLSKAAGVPWASSPMNFGRWARGSPEWRRPSNPEDRRHGRQRGPPAPSWWQRSLTYLILRGRRGRRALGSQRRAVRVARLQDSHTHAHTTNEAFGLHRAFLCGCLDLRASKNQSAFARAAPVWTSDIWRRDLPGRIFGLIQCLGKKIPQRSHCGRQAFVCLSRAGPASLKEFQRPPKNHHPSLNIFASKLQGPRTNSP